MGEQDKDSRLPSKSHSEARVRVAAEIGDEIRRLEERMASFWKRRIVGLSLLGLVNIILVLDLGDFLWSVFLGLFTIGVFFSYQRQEVGLKRRKLLAEEKFEALIPSGAAQPPPGDS